jgi:hypothetical protein
MQAQMLTIGDLANNGANRHCHDRGVWDGGSFADRVSLRLNDDGGWSGHNSLAGHHAGRVGGSSRDTWASWDGLGGDCWNSECSSLGNSISHVSHGHLGRGRARDNGGHRNGKGSRLHDSVRRAAHGHFGRRRAGDSRVNSSPLFAVSHLLRRHVVVAYCSGVACGCHDWNRSRKGARAVGDSEGCCTRDYTTALVHVDIQ